MLSVQKSHNYNDIIGIMSLSLTFCGEGGFTKSLSNNEQLNVFPLIMNNATDWGRYGIDGWNSLLYFYVSLK